MISSLPVTGVSAASALAAELKRRWRQGEPPDAVSALACHPDLAQHKSLVIDLAYEEYLLREKAGVAPEIGSFADRFPVFRASIRNMLDAHRLLTEHPELLDPAAGAWPEPGARFEGLEVQAELGRGTFGRAYLTFDPDTDRLCVLKLTTGRSAEARVIGRLAHPNVTDVYWARVVGFRTAICMPFVGVSTLADVISAVFPRPGSPLPPVARAILEAAEVDRLAGCADRRSAPVVRPDEPYLVGACAVAAKIAEAVAYLNDVGVTHGDLKPSNIVVGPGGSPHLIDFNLSTVEASQAQVRGTPAYMAPELIETMLAGKPATGIDAARADLFSLGVVVAELLTGRLPFPMDSPGSLTPSAHAVRRAVPELPAALPSAVTSVLVSCMAFDPMRRPDSAGAVASALGRYVAAWRSRGRRRRVVALAVVSLALIGPGAAVTVKVWPPPAPGNSAGALRPPETADEFFDRGRTHLRVGNVSAARADFIACHERSGNPWALAFVAYGMALDGQSGPSIAAAKRAIKDGAVSAEVYNNLGYALSQSARPAEAIPLLDEAIRRSPGMRAAFYNRAVARYRAGLGTGKAADLRAAEDITTALSLGSPSAELHFDAARIYAACSDRDPALRATAIEQIRAAIRAGKDPAACRSDVVLRTRLGGDRAFEAACATPRGTPPAKPPQIRLVEPRV